MKRSLLLCWTALAGLLVYLAVIVAIFAWQRDLLYHPFGRSAAPAAVGVPEMAVVKVRTVDGLTIAGWYAPPRLRHAPTVMLFHGNTGTLAMRAFKARRFLDAGMGVWLAGYRGFDGNPGWPTEDGLYADARAALDWLATHGTGAGQVVVYGESLGTGVAMQMAVERAVAGVVLEAPFTSIPDVAELRYPLVPVHWLALDRFDSLSKAPLVRAPLLVVHGERDAIIPAAMARRLLDAAPQPKEGVFLGQAGHIDLYDWGAGHTVVDFIRRRVDVATEQTAEDHGTERLLGP